MSWNENTGSVSKGSRVSGRALSGVLAALLLADGVAKLFKPGPVLEGTVRLGYSESVIVPLGIVLTLCTLLYLVPRTAVLGAILLTGYLGGAVATHVRAGGGWFEILFPVAMGLLLWFGLWLRDARLRALAPFVGVGARAEEQPAPGVVAQWGRA